ncbi:Do family serine endopeptidase [Novosphingobium sp. FSY-8]|uniref:Probable periplasmic serine endoprotease DegP-like n=1 Tax=Novosphingobium ovatum TaxID=1908523 RepID=A0ABW9XDH6_9SPHN|nr:Do family serine endopeptidase [Novosphingobium ovatum]NBC36588.1 Do family serine endopeptidase [Novosphingobium ovatum]
MPVRYAYGLTSALLVGGAAVSLITGMPAGAQVAQNDQQRLSQIVPRAGAPASFADLTHQLQPAVVNISTRQRVRVAGGAQGGANPFAGTPLEGIFGDKDGSDDDFGGRGNGGDPRGGNSFGGQRGGGQTREAQSLGSGFIVSADGFVVTNAHVITPEGQGVVETISVTMADGTEYPARLIGKDTTSDLAVLKIDAGKALPFVKFGDSNAARVGDWVIAIGNPFGLGGTVTAGIISAVYRNIGSGSPYDRYLQTDAAINQGNSGGPMFDMRGQVIGINRAIFSPTGGSVGIGFAIPAEIAAPIVDKLMRGQSIERGYLGVRIQPLSDELAESMGLPHNKGEIVQMVEPGKAGALGGIKAGDVVVKVSGKDVTREQTLSFLVASTAPGTRIPIEVIRDGKRVMLEVTVGRRPSDEELAGVLGGRRGAGEQGGGPGGAQQGAQTRSNVIEQALGLRLRPLTPAIARELNMQPGTQGLVVADVDASSDAGAKGLQSGDVLLAAGGRPVGSLAELEGVIRAAKAAGRSAISLQVLRPGEQPVFIGLRLR